MHLHRPTLIVGLLIALAYVLIGATTVSGATRVEWLAIGILPTVALAFAASLFAGFLVRR